MALRAKTVLGIQRVNSYSLVGTQAQKIDSKRVVVRILPLVACKESMSKMRVSKK